MDDFDPDGDGEAKNRKQKAEIRNREEI